MKRYAAALLFTLCACVTAQCMPRAGTIMPKDAFASDLNWVADRLGMRAPDAGDVVVVFAHDLMKSMGPAELQPAHGVDRKALHALGGVWLSERYWNGSDYERSFLVHELVHVVQAANGHPMGCSAEADAYRIQNEWLAQRGLPPAADQAFIDAHGCAR